MSAPAVSRGGEPGGLVVCSPLRLEARAVRRGIGEGGEVLRTGYGSRRSLAAADRLRSSPFGMLAISGTGGGLSADLKPGDLVVGTEVGEPGSNGAAALSCPSAPLLAGELRRAGLRARAGKIVTVDHLVRRDERATLASGGAEAADLESAMLLTAAGGRPAVVVRAVSDTAEQPLLSPRALAGGAAALRSLRLAGPVLAKWAAAGGQRTGAAGWPAVVLRRGGACDRDSRPDAGPGQPACLRP